MFLLLVYMWVYMHVFHAGPLQYNIIKFDTMIKIEIKGHKHKGESKQQCNQIMKKLLVQKDKLICSKMQTSPKLMHITW